MDYQVLRNELKNIRSWIFDLDDTLYPPSNEIYSQMTRRIRAYIMQALGIDEETASVVQKDYYKKYGATVHGLMVEHNISPEDFTNYVHELDLSSLQENPQLKACLDALPGKKYVFTNGAYHHAERVLKKLNIRACFSGIFSIREAGYVPKPAEQTYLKMMQTFHIKPREGIMFDDSPANILAAKKVGLHTVWISSNVTNNRYCSVDTKDFCDYETPDLTTFLSELTLKKTA